MTANRVVPVLLLLPFLVGFDLLTRPNRAVESGNAALKAGNATEALRHYDEAMKGQPQEPGIQFNRGRALGALGRHDEAGEAFLRATEAKSSALKASAFFNLGNTFFRGEKYDEAIEAYKRALVLAPGDAKAKWNLELALKKRQEKPNENQGGDDKKKPSGDKQDKSSKPPEQNGSKDDGSEGSEGSEGSKGEQPQPQSGDKDQQQQQDQQPEPKDGEEQKPQPQNADEAAPQGGAAGDKAGGEGKETAEMREIDAVLDGLEKSPKDLERQRAKLRAVRRSAPSKDW